MNSNFILLISLLGLIFSLFSWSCNSKSDSVNDENLNFTSIKVIYVTGGCCSNLELISLEDFHDAACPPYSSLYSINLEDFDIPSNFSYGDTLSIRFDFLGPCEADSVDPNCPLPCDSRNGTPIKIISLDPE